MDFQLIIVHKKVLKIHEIFLSNQFNIYPLEVNNKYESNLVSEFEMRPKNGFQENKRKCNSDCVSRGPVETYQKVGLILVGARYNTTILQCLN